MRLCDGSGVELVRLIRAGEVSAVEVLTAHLDQIAGTDEVIHGWELVDAGGALDQARRIDEQVRTGAEPGPLAGLPVGVKDVIDVRGLPTGAGFDPYRKDRIAADDAACVRALRRAGAVVVGKTVTVQFALGQDDPGTRNPRDPRRTAGGSSSGSAAAVAANQVPVTLGTQTTGSLLRPAAYCGVVGFKPSFGWIDNDGVLPTSWSSDHVGVIARSVADAELVYGAMVGDTAPAGMSAAPPRLGVVVDLVAAARPDVRAGVRDALDRLESAGATLVECELPAALELLLAVHWLGVLSDGSAIHMQQLDHLADDYGPLVRANLEMGALIPASAYVHASRLKRRLRPRMSALVSSFDALVAPTAPDRPPLMDGSVTHNPLGDPSFQAPWTCFGLPNISVPLPERDGHTDAIQLIGAAGQERSLLPVAYWCEERMAG